jgi:hypothetical protein
MTLSPGPHHTALLIRKQGEFFQAYQRMEAQLEKPLEWQRMLSVFKAWLGTAAVTSTFAAISCAYFEEWKGAGLAAFITGIALFNIFVDDRVSSRIAEPEGQKRLRRLLRLQAIAPKKFEKLYIQEGLLKEGLISKQLTECRYPGPLAQLFQTYAFICAKTASTHVRATKKPDIDPLEQRVHQATFHSFKLLAALFFGYSLYPWRYPATIAPLLDNETLEQLFTADRNIVQRLKLSLPRIQRAQLDELSVHALCLKLFPAEEANVSNIIPGSRPQLRAVAQEAVEIKARRPLAKPRPSPAPTDDAGQNLGLVPR